MDEIMQEFSKAYDALQELDIRATKNNIIILHYVMDTMQKVYKTMQAEGVEQNGTV